MKAFLMIGQSNMAGRGDFEEVEPLVNGHTFMLRNGRWQPMSEPINPDRSVIYPLSGAERVHSGVSLAASFADAWARRYGEDVGLIPCADGGSAIRDWAPGGLLFDHAVMQTALALRTASLEGILWHQGESDSKTQACVDAYFEALTDFFRALRGALNQGETPVVMGELGDIMAYHDGVCHLYPQINREIHKAAAAIGNCGVASAAGLTMRHDKLHFNSPSLRTFGVRYFEVYEELCHPTTRKGEQK